MPEPKVLHGVQGVVKGLPKAAKQDAVGEEEGQDGDTDGDQRDDEEGAKEMVDAFERFGDRHLVKMISGRKGKDDLPEIVHFLLPSLRKSSLNWIVLIAALVWLRRNRLPDTSFESVTLRHAFDLLRQVRFGFGALCIFLYVGAEVSIGSLIVSYLMQSGVLGLGQEDAGKHVPYYWGGAMVGRFIGAYLLRVLSPGKVLACAAAVASLRRGDATSVLVADAGGSAASAVVLTTLAPREEPWNPS